LRFFALLGSLFAMEEKSVLVPGTPEDRKELKEEALHLSRRIRAIERLEHFGSIVKHLSSRRKRKHRLFLMHLKPADNVTTITGYPSEAMRQATSDYLKMEKDADSARGEDVVLVTADSVEALRRAYPNYFMDTKSLVRSVIRSLKRDRARNSAERQR